MKRRMNVYLTNSKKSLFYAYPAIHSLFKENQNSEIYLYIVSEDLEETDIFHERELAEKYGHRIIILHFDEEKARTKISAKHPEHWPLGALGCYWMFHELLPEDVDKIIAIEADTVTVGDISDFYFTDLEGYYAACPGPEHKPGRHRELARRLGGEVFTFVMSLYNVKKIRENFLLNDILRTDAMVVEKFGHSQQELTFGILFRGKTKFFPGISSCIEENRQSMGELGYDYIKSCEDTCPVLHFSSFVEKEKPWNPVCVMPGYAVWWKYAQESPYYKQYIEEQWKIFDRKSEEIEHLKKNITYRNVLGMTLGVAAILVMVVSLSVLKLSFVSGLSLILCFAAALGITLLFRKLTMMLQK